MDKNNKSKNKFVAFMAKVRDMFCKVMFPEDIKCIFCGTDIADFENKPYCDDCEKELSFNNGNKCLICSEPIDNEAKVCDRCQKNKRNFKKAFCPFVYDGVVRNSILAYKDSNRRYLAKSFAKFIAKELTDNKVAIDVITFVPLTDKKKKQRSFNQAELLANELGKVLAVPVEDMFVKNKDSKTQKFSSYKERQQNMIGTYSVKNRKFKKKENVLIVDDIITTCATVDYCAGLINKKVANVYVCAIARNKLKSK